MPITLLPIKDTNAVIMGLTGKLEKSDFADFVPKLDELIEKHGRVRLLVEMRDFHGLKLGAIWEDLKFGVRHHADFERIACVGDKQWEEVMVALAKPFTGAPMKYFDLPHIKEAREWLMSDEPAETDQDVARKMVTPF